MVDVYLGSINTSVRLSELQGRTDLDGLDWILDQESFINQPNIEYN